MCCILGLIVAPNYAPTLTVVRYDDNKVLSVSWNPVIPDHRKGEGNMFGYEIEYRNKKIVNATVLEQVLGTSVQIEGLYSEGVYEVHVRCVVVVQSLPLSTEYERGPWSEWVESDGSTAPTGTIISQLLSDTSSVFFLLTPNCFANVHCYYHVLCFLKLGTLLCRYLT